MYRLRLTSGQLALFSSVTRSDTLKREMIGATELLPAGTCLRVGERMLRLGRQLGSGLVGVVYEAWCQDTGERLALKRARAHFHTFRESFRLERAAAEVLSSLSALRPARVVDHAPHVLIKEFLAADTLQALLIRGEVSSRQREALVHALRETAEVNARLGFLVDLSPKNLCWQDGWVLLDSGPKTHVNDYSAVLDAPSWEQYVGYFERKGSVKRGDSAPAVLSRERAREDVPQARSYAFVRDWWMWIPYDAQVQPERYFVSVDEQQPEDEALFRVDWERGGALEPAPGGDARLKSSELVRACAVAAWRRQHPRMALPSGALPSRSLPAELGPLSLAALAAEVEPLGLGRALKAAVSERERLEVPRLRARPYKHWTALGRGGNEHRATDIFCHEPLPAEQGALGALLAGRRHWRVSVPLSRGEGPFCELLCIPVGNCQRALLFIPGFRAAHEAQAPLASELVERGVEGLYVLAYLGVRNPEGQALVTSGRWESVLLWNAVDCLTECLGTNEVVLVSASHGAVGSAVVASLHPRVVGLSMDSGIERPLELLLKLAEWRGESTEGALGELQAQHLPRPFQLKAPVREGLRTLALQPLKDSFVSVCGELSAGHVIRYEGAHAATMRHDSPDKGVPRLCVEALQAFLEPGT
jgi:hypothetical protein